jgi:hypothetical protein
MKDTEKSIETGRHKFLLDALKRFRISGGGGIPN